MTLQQKAYRTALKRGKYDKPKTIATLMMGVVGECAEVVDADARGYKADTDKFQAELADVVINCMSIAEHLNFDLEKAIKKKMVFNDMRED